MLSVCFADLREQEQHCSSHSLFPRSLHPIKSPSELPHAGSGILNVQPPEGRTNSRLTTPKNCKSPSAERKPRQNADLRFL